MVCKRFKELNGGNVNVYGGGWVGGDRNDKNYFCILF